MIDKTLRLRGPQLIERETFVRERPETLNVGIHICDGRLCLSQGRLRCEHNHSPQTLLNVSRTQGSLSEYTVCRGGGEGERRLMPQHNGQKQIYTQRRGFSLR